MSLESFTVEKRFGRGQKRHQMKVMNKKRFRKGSKTLAYRNNNNKKAMFQFSIHYHRCERKRIDARLASKLILKSERSKTHNENMGRVRE